MKSLFVTSALLICFGLSTASMAETAVTPPKTADTAKSVTLTPEQKAKSEECSTEADKKGLHGKARKKFRSECKSKK